MPRKRPKAQCSTCEARTARVAALRARLEQPVRSWSEHADVWQLLADAAPELVQPIAAFNAAVEHLTARQHADLVALSDADAHLARSLGVRIGLHRRELISRALAELASTLEPTGAVA